jgi:hypothetical protein
VKTRISADVILERNTNREYEKRKKEKKNGEIYVHRVQ